MTRNFLLATALSLAIALGGLVMLSSGSAQASSFEGVAVSAAPITDAEACSTVGSYNAGYYNPGGIYYVNTWDMPVVTPYPGLPYGYWGGYGWPFYTGITTTAVVVPASPWLPNETQPYTAGNINNYACNMFSNCQPVANANAVVCPGNPAGISLNSSLTSATCGSATNIDAKVVGANGLSVADGTPVLFSTTLGLVPADTTTDDGIASVSLVFPPKTSGVATLTVTSGTAKAEAKITVTC
jgi:hypothetical protein